MVDERGRERARYVMLRLLERAREKQVGVPALRSTDYINTIPPEREPWFPGDEEMERQVRRLIRWNAAVMVSSANRKGLEVGGHIASYASAASLYEVGYNHFFRGKDHPGGGDQLYIQGHASPGIYARAYLMKRLTAEQLGRFRQEVQHGPGQGLSSYPHPRLMPDFWEFPTVSMGLGALNAIYQARFNRYLQNRGIKDTSQQHVWAFLGDGEMGEPESLGAIGLAAREELDNLTFVINCNLQQLDGPVRGNGKIMQELEAFFRGAGWNVIKVVWGREWDPLLARDVDGVLVNQMNRTPDGQFQTYSVESGAYIREHFFGVDNRLKKMVEHLTDEQIERLPRGGHDYRKVYAAFQAAANHVGPADGDPGPHGEGLDDRGAGGQERHPPDEEAQRRHAQGLPRPARAADLRQGHRRALHHRRLRAVLPPGRGQRRARLPARAPARARRRRADAARAAAADHPARQGDVRRAAGRVGQAGDRHHDGARPAPQGPDEGPVHRRADRADRARRVPHLRHGLDVLDGQDLQPGRADLRVGRPPAVAVLQGVRPGPDAPRGHLRGGLRRVGDRGRVVVLDPRRADDPLLHLLLDVRLPAHGRLDLGDGRPAGPRLPHRRHGRPHHADRRRSPARRRPLAAARPHQPGRRPLRPGVRLRGRPHRAARSRPDVRLERAAPARRGRHLLPHRLQRADGAAGRARAHRPRGSARRHPPRRDPAGGTARRGSARPAARQRRRATRGSSRPSSCSPPTGASGPTCGR